MMRSLFAAAVLATGAAAAVPGMTKPKCRTTCQRFGMKDLLRRRRLG